MKLTGDECGEEGDERAEDYVDFDGAEFQCGTEMDRGKLGWPDEFVYDWRLCVGGLDEESVKGSGGENGKSCGE